ncbi:MAG: hypothetical protein LDL11_03260 [Desulfarculus sp.]|nr:hypothetical protein [Desulfarculus sp.]
MGAGIERYEDKGRLVALVLRQDADLGPGAHFLTDPEMGQQLALMDHPAGHRIKAHVHNSSPRNVELTGEVLIIRRGRLRVNLFRANGAPLHSLDLEPGDVILLNGGAHGFEVLEACQMIEVKQGPYLGLGDKRLLFPDPA